MPGGHSSDVELRKWHNCDGPQNGFCNENDENCVNSGYDVQKGRAISRIVNGTKSIIDFCSQTSRKPPGRVPGGHAPVNAFGVRHGLASWPQRIVPFVLTR